jgi:hypothetical protein
MVSAYRPGDDLLIRTCRVVPRGNPLNVATTRASCSAAPAKEMSYETRFWAAAAEAANSNEASDNEREENFTIVPEEKARWQPCE